MFNVIKEYTDGSWLEELSPGIYMHFISLPKIDRSILMDNHKTTILTEYTK